MVDSQLINAAAPATPMARAIAIIASLVHGSIDAAPRWTAAAHASPTPLRHRTGSLKLRAAVRIDNPHPAGWGSSTKV